MGVEKTKRLKRVRLTGDDPGQGQPINARSHPAWFDLVRSGTIGRAWSEIPYLSPPTEVALIEHGLAEVKRQRDFDKKKRVFIRLTRLGVELRDKYDTYLADQAAKKDAKNEND